MAKSYAMLTVKLPPARLEEFRIAATLRGATMSSLVQQFITQVVRQEMIAVPKAFQRRGNHLNDTENLNLINLLDQSNN